MTAIFGLILSIQFVINAYAVVSNDDDNQTPSYTWKRIVNFEDMFNIDSTSLEETEGTEATPQTQILESNRDEVYELPQNSSISIHTDSSSSSTASSASLPSIRRTYRSPKKTDDFPLAGSSSTNRKSHLTITIATKFLPSTTMPNVNTPASSD